MQPSEIEKIKELVKASSLLSVNEKEEWLALIGIMNDKQLGELRDILLSAVEKRTGASEELPDEDNQDQKRLSSPQFPLFNTQKAKIPPLPHILNLPKVGAVFPKQEPRTKNQEPKEAEKRGFWKRIKEILAEKELPSPLLRSELPAGHPEVTVELKLPASTDASLGESVPESKVGIQKSAIRNQQSEIINYKFQKAEGEKEVLKENIGQPKQPVVPKPVQKPFLTPIRPASASPVMPKVDLHVGTLSVEKLVMAGDKHKQQRVTREEEGESIPALQSAQAEITQAGENTADKKIAEERVFVSGLKDTGILVEAKLGKRKAGPQLPISAAPKMPSKPLSPMHLSSLTEVSMLTPEDIHKDLVGALRNLLVKFDYHKLQAALEKSRLYAAYINTGLAVLAGKLQLDEVKSDGEYLNRQEFERFVDVLRAIKS